MKKTDLLVRAARLEIERDEAIESRKRTEEAYRDLLNGRISADSTVWGLKAHEWLDIQTEHRRYRAALQEIVLKGDRKASNFAFDALQRTPRPETPSPGKVQS